ncbi:rod shape determining protein RodA [Thermocatellispora tengchongensis]|uniref:peptidoglycan glycosyltransferase n=1 Tax=Thermocatellispora tengchongensis TaxID=1073253 RepID=A0A840PG33_9ACTN|nr:rod shape-determining protein RodA [Thermocatellispora tengchongensis]MBB5138112.1 rod shape determining protein RodA [Thermocatellispora tengchongensis]
MSAARAAYRERGGTWRRPFALRVVDRLKRPDWVLYGCAAALTLTGLLLIWSATRPGLIQQGGDPSWFLRRQGIAAGIGVALMVLIARSDLRILRAYVPMLYVVALLGLAVVLSPLGSTVNGSKSWIVLGGGVQFQPSEFAKLALVLGVAVPLGELRDGERRPGVGALLLALVLAALPALLILAEPDLGTALVFVAMTAGMVLVSGVRKVWLGALAAAGVGVAALAWFLGLIRPYQLQRLLVLADPDADPLGAGYNAAQAKIAIGSGGFSGQGLFRGGQTAGEFVPEQHSDFIFTVAGEELGFVGAGAILVVMLALLWRGLRIAARSVTPYGTVIAAGTVCWLAFQTFVNVGMTLGIMPIIGVPLPFLSYGGSATISGLVAVGLLQAVHRQVGRGMP